MSVTINGSGTISGVNATGLTTAQTVTSSVLSGDAIPIGVNQTWQGVTRAIGTTYTNSTGRPILAAITYSCSAANTVQGLIINGTTVYAGAVTTAGYPGSFVLLIPNGATYVTTTNVGTLTLVTWTELR
jgi:ABC-type multidrug transport system permease subunit